MQTCPYCKSRSIKKKSFYLVKHSNSRIRRYLCTHCCKSFSSKTKSPTYYQKKPFLNQLVYKLLMSGNTQRRSSRLLKCSRLTIERKLIWLRRYQIKAQLTQQDGLHLQFDELETIEHTKLKPLTIPLCVSSNYKIMALSVGKMRAKGHLSAISIKKYGPRDDEKLLAITEVFEKLIADKIKPLSITTDAHPIYVSLIKKYFPTAEHIQVISKELIKKKKELIYTAERKRIFNPLFAIDQRMAMLRSDIRRLTRRSWCTTKKIENLKRHLELYQNYNNENLPA